MTSDGADLPPPSSGEDTMNRSNETRLRKLENETAGDVGVALIVFGPDETAEEATERHFERRPQDRARLRTICIADLRNDGAA
jgi:hypothetical protein